jgi:hypothetical protein
MKKLFDLTLVSVVLVLAGCASPKRVSHLEGAGTKQLYAAPMDAVWRATLDAVDQNGLRVYSADRTTGYIDARRSIRPHTLGENVGIWVRSAGLDRTDVEVVSRQAGPPVAWVKNWENEIQRSIADNLSRDPAAVSTTVPREPYVDPRVSERERVRQSIPVPATPTARLREEQLRYNELIAKRDTAEATLLREADELRRVELQRELERLREEIRLQEERVQSAERDAGRR